MNDAAVARVRGFFETLTEASLAAMEEIYAADAWFKDPFNEVTGIEAIRGIFRRMYRSTLEPRFAVTGVFASADGVMLAWDFRFRLRAWQRQVERRVAGVSHLRFDAAGRITYHRDYWDPAEGLYQHLPLVGPLLRWLRRRVG